MNHAGPVLHRRFFLALSAILLATTFLLTGNGHLPVAVGKNKATSAQEATPAADGASEKADRKKSRKNSDDADQAADPAADAGATPVATDSSNGADDMDCIDFQTREDAQAALDANPDDPYNLDPNGDGIACALLPSAADPATADQPPAENTGKKRDKGAQPVEITCVTLSQEDAQTALDDGSGDPAILDPDGDGVACEAEELAPADPGAADKSGKRDKKKGGNDTAGESAAEPSGKKGASSTPEDIDCIDFTYQEEAQAVYLEDPTDPYNLDPNGDGFACSSLPSKDPRVSAVPATGTGPDVLGLPLVGVFAAAAAFAAAVYATRNARPQQPS
ncbi:MAG: hypothetical protein ACR2J8_00160 [Thermomicrobiales bacterium]